jgi:dTDP-4-dehydrorhamnose reductase
MKVLVLGPSGMLGHVMVDVLRASNFEVVTAGRSNSDIQLDARAKEHTDARLNGFEYIVNCIGLITHNIDEEKSDSVAEAELINTEFPKRLTAFAEEVGSKVIQIATDCVFSGAKGNYVESDIHDATDVYGLTKSAGEVVSENVMHLRASIVGKELKSKKSLLEWVLGQPEGAYIQGYIDRRWNGVTTIAFSKVVAGILQSNSFSPGTWHLVPKDEVSKFELVSLFAESFGRADLQVTASESGLAKDMTLSTEHPEANHRLWEAAGYQQIPAIRQLIAEIAN